ncbi:MAG: hypothetical protein AAGH88_04555 [Planctomycetota bacterium]
MARIPGFVSKLSYRQTISVWLDVPAERLSQNFLAEQAKSAWFCNRDA